ncbi:hypothetical protein H5410_040094 [Solanum commersonii]|uniref:Uncharacterized protein n=1 Tax=Solanum commersonii TaxID=4109 RepID=A0A9J5XQD6_SOLCO|nr:hypothetical protein H5410_040094 [Solanum commersonii]
MQYYFLGQKLWDIIGGSDITPPTDAEAAKMWKVKARKAMYALTVTNEDEFLQRIKNAKTPKEAWDTLATIFTKKNDARLQRLENDLFLTIKDKDKALFSKRQTYQKREAERSSQPMRDQENQHQRTQRQNKQAKGFNNRQMHKCYNCGKK